ncbi:hypothetical protein C1149_09755 [Clostridium botulinum]|nr:hypothetical protein C1149_09755 [Clostridium botulinum]
MFFSTVGAFDFSAANAGAVQPAIVTATNIVTINAFSFCFLSPRLNKNILCIFCFLWKYNSLLKMTCQSFLAI